MEIRRLNQSAVEIIVAQQPEPVTLLIDPFGLKPQQMRRSDILLLTEKKENWENIKGAPFLIAGSGEYEIKGVLIWGISALNKKKERVTIYTIEGEGLRLCHWGRLGQVELNSEQLDLLGGIDLLFIPIASPEGVAVTEAPALISQIGPKLIIPLDDSDSGKLKQFLKELGVKADEEQRKLKIKARDLASKEKPEVVLLKF